jgi:hypothetical protein
VLVSLRCAKRRRSPRQSPGHRGGLNEDPARRAGHRLSAAGGPGDFFAASRSWRRSALKLPRPGVAGGRVEPAGAGPAGAGHAAAASPERPFQAWVRSEGCALLLCCIVPTCGGPKQPIAESSPSRRWSRTGSRTLLLGQNVNASGLLRRGEGQASARGTPGEPGRHPRARAHPLHDVAPGLGTTSWPPSRTGGVRACLPAQAARPRARRHAPGIGVQPRPRIRLRSRAGRRHHHGPHIPGDGGDFEQTLTWCAAPSTAFTFVCSPRPAVQRPPAGCRPTCAGTGRRLIPTSSRRSPPAVRGSAAESSWASAGTATPPRTHQVSVNLGGAVRGGAIVR